MLLESPPIQRAVDSIRRLRHNEQFILSGLAVVIGAAAALAAIGFRYAITIIQDQTYSSRSETLASFAGALPWWRILLVPTLGGLLIGLFVYFFMPNRRPQGVAHVIEANALNGGRMSLTTGFMAATVSVASIGVGASVGREGPVVHLGASLGAWVANRLHLSRTMSRTLLGCGVAAAVAASFNAPIAGTFFALEVVIGHYALSAFAPIVIASVTGTIISRMYYGDFPAFILPEAWSIASLWEFPAFALLGIVCALAAIGFMNAIVASESLFEKIPLPSWARPALGGFLVGIIALGFPQVLGVGYETTDGALSGFHIWYLLIAFLFLKILATAISLGSGFGGGIFSPSLFIGAMTGGAYGVAATSIFPQLSSGQGVYSLIGMGAVAGAVLGAPISTILMIFEMTSDYALTIAVMVATVIASVVTQQIHGRSFFTWQLERRGISIKGGHEIGLLRAIEVKTVMDDNYEVISPDTPIATVRRRLQKAPWGELFVVENDGRLSGTIVFSDLHDAAFDTSHDDALSAGDVAHKNPAVLQACDDLETAVDIYGTSGEVHIPVVDSHESMRLLGLAHEHEVMLVYRRALNQARAEERGEG